MALIPAGTFSLGKAKKETKAFCIDVTEVTVAAYRACVDASVCTTKRLDKYGPCNWGVVGRERHPINCLSWHQAARYCAHVDKRLPSEEEWFYAAYGGDGRPYPWGNDEPSGQLCWDGKGNALGKGKRAGTTCPVGSYPAGHSPFGLEDMAGNVWEWTTGRIGSERIIRGGGSTTDRSDWVASGFSTAHFPTEGSNDIGGRCAR